MNKAKGLFLANVLMFLVFILTAVSGFVGRRSWFFGYHKGLGVILVLFVVAHFIAHWKWVVAMAKQFFKKNNVNI